MTQATMNSGTMNSGTITQAHPTPRSVDLAHQVHDIALYIEAWLRAHTLDIAAAFLAGAVLYVGLRAARRLIRDAGRRHADANGFGATALRVLARTRQFFLIMASIRLVVGYANPPELVYRTIALLFIVATAYQAAIWG
ncbi:MAG: hypothetical protein ACKOUM_12460, partial [Sphingopyxis sp.]